MKSLIYFFKSVNLAIFLLIIITSASIIGTLIPQGRGPEEYAVRFGQLANLFQKLQLTNLYKSSWFITLLFLFSINIITCTLTRLFPKLRRFLRPSLERNAKKILNLKIKDNFKKPWDLAKTKDEVVKKHSTFHYRLKQEKKDNRLFLLARKKTLGLFGSDIVHLGLLVILIGGIVSGLGGFRDNLILSEGQSLPVPKADFKIRLDKFETELYAGGMVKDWKSTLTVIEKEKALLTKTIEVNHPLSYKGYVFYQSSYGWDWKNPSVKILVKKRNDPSFSRTVNAKLGEKVPIQYENIHLTVIHFIPDFVINEQGQITSRSRESHNPAAYIEGWEEEERVISGWIFARFPDFERIHSEKEADLKFELKDFTAGQYSVIQAAKDPGVTLIWIGSSLLMVGLILAFYWPSREIKIILEEDEGKTEVIAGGLAPKGKDAFQSEFDKIMTSLRR